MGSRMLDSIYGFPDRERKILAKTVKLMEEVGEPSNLLADSVGIGIAGALKRRIEKIRERRH